MRSKSRIADELGCARRARAKLDRRLRITTRKMESVQRNIAELRGQDGKEDERLAVMSTYSELTARHTRLTLDLVDAQGHLSELEQEYNNA